MYAGFYDDQRAALADVADRIPEEELKVLSDAERKVFDVFRNNRGISNKEIGKILNISEETVKDHISSICDKLGIREGRGRRRELAAKYPPNKT
jgi:ATP/maltotriose-dependent transcriptional regulator MalT